MDGVKSEFEGEHGGTSDLLKILTNQPRATPPALGSSGGYKDQPEEKIGNNLRKKKKVSRSVAKQQIQ